MRVEGISDLLKQLEKLKESVEAADGDNEVDLLESFTPEFMEDFTEFTSFEEFLEQSPWDAESVEEIARLPDQQVDDYVAEHTRFRSSLEMAEVAATVYRVRNQ